MASNKKWCGTSSQASVAEYKVFDLSGIISCLFHMQNLYKPAFSVTGSTVHSDDLRDPVAGYEHFWQELKTHLFTGALAYYRCSHYRALQTSIYLLNSYSHE